MLPQPIVSKSIPDIYTALVPSAEIHEDAATHVTPTSDGVLISSVRGCGTIYRRGLSLPHSQISLTGFTIKIR